MRIYDYIGLTTQEVPFALHTSFCVAGCPNNCPNCSWNNMKNKPEPYELTEELYRKILDSVKGMTELIVFLGGEWEHSTLIKYLKIAREEYKIPTCLYTGIENQEDVLFEIKQNLDYLKTGHYIERLGPLSSKTTNQRFIRLKDNKVLNFYFQEPQERWKEFLNG